VPIDSGGGSALRFGQAGAHVAQLDAVLFTHLHIDHSADLIRLGGIQPDRRCVSSNLVGRHPAVLTLLGASQKVLLAVKLATQAGG
jgi:ribonuclease BN (tRNA processing enzyme)